MKLAGSLDGSAVPAFAMDLSPIRGKISFRIPLVRDNQLSRCFDETEARVRALEDAIVVVFLISPKARVTHTGTIGH
jgi:hypothetical protein